MALRRIPQTESELGEEEDFQLAIAISQIEAEERTEKSVDEKLIDFMAKSIEKKEAELECPVCFDIAEVPIFMCQQQHLICASCQPKLTACPECREPYQKPPRRHRYAERDVEELKKMKDELSKMTETKGDSEKEIGDQPDSNTHLPEIQKVKTAVDATAGIKTLLNSAWIHFQNLDFFSIRYALANFISLGLSFVSILIFKTNIAFKCHV